MIRKNETGRSMVEMLGVLAIIGVLSVAGIKGYTIAMRKYRANEISHAISMMASSMKTANGGAGIDADHPKSYTDLLNVTSELSGVSELKATSDDTIFLELNGGEDLCNAVEQLFGNSDTNPIYVPANLSDCEDEQLTFKIK